MATIDKLDLSVYNLYAIRTRMIEQINEQFQLDKASSIPPQTVMVDFFPKLTEIDLLLGITPTFTPWAYFYPPRDYRFMRRSPFAFYRIVPSLGSLKDQEEEESKFAAIETNSPEEEEEKAIISNCFAQIDKINGWLSFIVGRVGQFLQG
jgi:Family of unknown function (DUF5399)